MAVRRLTLVALLITAVPEGVAPKSDSHAIESDPGGVNLLKRVPREIKSDDFHEICDRGQSVNLDEKRCDSCPSDHYMPDVVHSQLRCYPCRHAIPNSSEVDLIPCTKTTDTIIGCKDGHFLQLAALYDDNLVMCLPCSKCNESNPLSYEIKPCGKSVDTVCCPHPGMVAIQKEGEYNYECKTDIVKAQEQFVKTSTKASRDTSVASGRYHYEDFQLMSSQDFTDSGIHQITCHAGQFLKVDEVTKMESCSACPKGTFMTDKNHTWLKCKSCKVRPNNPDEIMGCISAKESPVVVACLNHKFIHYPAPKDRRLRECSACPDTYKQYDIQDGSVEGQPCSNSSDPNCPEQNMIFVDGECRESELPSSSKAPSTFSATPSHTSIAETNQDSANDVTTAAISSTPNSVSKCSCPEEPLIAIICLSIVVAILVILVIIMFCFPDFIKRCKRKCSRSNSNVENQPAVRNGAEENLILHASR